jgi:hypothetical protein
LACFDKRSDEEDPVSTWADVAHPFLWRPPRLDSRRQAGTTYFRAAILENCADSHTGCARAAHTFNTHGAGRSAESKLLGPTWQPWEAGNLAGGSSNKQTRAKGKRQRSGCRGSLRLGGSGWVRGVVSQCTSSHLISIPNPTQLSRAVY